MFREFPMLKIAEYDANIEKNIVPHKIAELERVVRDLARQPRAGLAEDRRRDPEARPGAERAAAAGHGTRPVGLAAEPAILSSRDGLKEGL